MHRDKKNEFDRQLAAKFESFRPDMPGGLWDKIASKLDEQEQSNIVPIKKQRRFPTWWISVAASLLVVCGMVYWYNRPMAVTYLHNPVAHVEEPPSPPAEELKPEPAPVAEPLDIDRLKQLFARSRQKNEAQTKMTLATAPQVSENQQASRSAGTSGNQPLIAEKATSAPPTRAENGQPLTLPSADQPISEEAIAATVPDIQPPVVLEEEEETLLDAAETSKQPFGVSNILNYVVGAVDQRDEKLVTFSDDGEGSLTLDFNFSLAKNKKKRIK